MMGFVKKNLKKLPRSDNVKIPDELEIQIFANMNIYEPAPVPKGKFG